MKKRKIIIYLIVGVMIVATVVGILTPFMSYGAESQDTGQTMNKTSGKDIDIEADVSGISIEEFQLEDIEKFLEGLAGEYPVNVSFGELMQEIMKGNLQNVLKICTTSIKSALLGELKTNTALMGQVVVLALIGAVFSSFSGIFGSGHVSETGFYVVYMLTMTFLAASFFASVEIAANLTGDLLEFMQVLLPAYFLAVAAAGGALTSAAVCGFTIGAIGLVQSVMSQILIPFTRVYMIMVLAGNLYKEDMISKLTELLGNVITWALKAMFGVIVGFHVIQGMVVPQADAMKNASAMRLAQMIPGIGTGAGAVSQIVMGSGVLIKNTVGAAAVVILCIIAVVPMIKLAILMILYYLAAAAMQPVCDKRLVSCMSGAAAGHGILLKLTGYSLALFAVTIAVICVSTNAVWYAG